MDASPKPSAAEPIRDDFPPATMPTVYADGVTSAAPSPQVMKFFLSRVEPHLRAENRTMIQPIVQVVMPLGGFLQTVFFFENIVKNMQAQGSITPDQIAEARALAGGKTQ